MKKICFSFLMLILLFLHIPSQQASGLDFDGRYTFYSTQKISDQNCSVVKNGRVFEISCDAAYAKSLRLILDEVIGESVCFYGDENDFVNISRSLGNCVFYGIDGVMVAEGFSSRLGKTVEGKEGDVNFQAAFSEGIITVGTPVILGSF